MDALVVRLLRGDRLRQIALVLGLAAVAASCSTTHTAGVRSEAQIQRPSEGRARVYLYRPSQQGISTPPAEIFVDGRSVVVLPSETFTSLELFPGRHEVTAHVQGTFSDYWLPPVAFNSEVNKVYFLYPIATIGKEDIPTWKPLAIAYASAIVTGGNAILLTPGGEADVVLERYWQLDDESTPDAYIDQMKGARYIAPGSKGE